MPLCSLSLWEARFEKWTMVNKARKTQGIIDHAMLTNHLIGATCNRPLNAMDILKGWRALAVSSHRSAIKW